MLKFLFWSLLFANVVLFAYQRGYLGAWISDGHEPTRIAQQFHADQMKPIAASAIVIAAATGPAGMAASTPEAPSCMEIGNFDAATAKRFETQLLPLALGDKLSRHDIQEAARNMVYIPAQGSKEAADKKASELRNLGIHDFYIIQDAGELHWGISLGVFKTEEAARTQLAALNLKGVHSARLGTRSVAASKVAFQLHDLDAETTAGVGKIKLQFPQAETRSCETASSADSPSVAPVAKETFPREMTH